MSHWHGFILHSLGMFHLVGDPSMSQCHRHHQGNEAHNTSRSHDHVTTLKTIWHPVDVWQIYLTYFTDQPELPLKLGRPPGYLSRMWRPSRARWVRLPEPYLTSWECRRTLCLVLSSLTSEPQVTPCSSASLPLQCVHMRTNTSDLRSTWTAWIISICDLCCPTIIQCDGCQRGWSNTVEHRSWIQPITAWQVLFFFFVIFGGLHSFI